MSDFKNKKIIINAPAKINLHLEVIGKRKDGFHELAMVMQSINLSDQLEIEINNNGKLNLKTDSVNLDNGDENLIIKAARLIKDYSGKKELGANIFLRKNIPIGAGLAGGSSDAAATLIGLNKLWNLNFNSKILHQLAVRLGSDVPFCIKGGSQFCFGRGEILKKYNFTNPYGLLLIKNPNISISTEYVYRKYYEKYSRFINLSNINIEKKRETLKNFGFINKDIFQKKIKIRNDLQKIVQYEFKSVNDGLNILSNLDNSLCFSMSGSGPSCYAIFEDINMANKIYKKNIEIFKKFDFDVWVCQFHSKGIEIV